MTVIFVYADELIVLLKPPVAPFDTNVVILLCSSLVFEAGSEAKVVFK